MVDLGDPSICLANVRDDNTSIHDVNVQDDDAPALARVRRHLK